MCKLFEIISMAIAIVTLRLTLMPGNMCYWSIKAY